MTPRVTVIVPVHDDADRLVRCLAALRDQTYTGPTEVVVVDNASRDDVAAALPADGTVRLVREPRPGSYRARNAGAAVARGDVIAFTDADCLPRPTWLERAVDRLESDRSLDAVGGRIVLLFRHGDRPTTGPEHYEVRHTFRQDRYVSEWSFAATANLVVRAEALHRAGPFDARLRSGGDLDWGRRLVAAGGRLAYAPEAVVEHPSRPSWRELVTKSARVAGGLADRDAAAGRGARLRAAAHDARNALAVWRSVWRDDDLASPRDRVTYATAYMLARGVRSWTYLRHALAAGQQPSRR